MGRLAGTRAILTNAAGIASREAFGQAKFTGHFTTSKDTRGGPLVIAASGAIAEAKRVLDEVLELSEPSLPPRHPLVVAAREFRASLR